MARPSTARHSSHSSPFRSEEERRHILSRLPEGTKVLATAPARIYQAPFGAREDGWAYTGLSGMLVFGRDRVVMHADKPLGAGPGTSFERRYWFRLVDTAPGKGVIWIHLIPTEFQYRFDKPFFHVFHGKSRMFGIRFEEDAHAERFYRKVSESHATMLPPRKISRGPSRAAPPRASSSSSSSTKPNSNPARIRRSMISGPVPGTFDHVAHAGFTDGHFEASGKVEPEWRLMVEQMQRHGISLAGLQRHRVDGGMLAKHRDFVDGFLQGAQAVQRENSRGACVPALVARPAVDPGRGPTAVSTAAAGSAEAKPAQRKSPHRKPVTVLPAAAT